MNESIQGTDLAGWLAGWLSTRMIPASPLPPPATAHAALAQPSGRASLSRAVPLSFSLWIFSICSLSRLSLSRSLAVDSPAGSLGLATRVTYS